MGIPREYHSLPHDSERWWSPHVMGCLCEESQSTRQVKMTAEIVVLPWQTLLVAALGRQVWVGTSLWRGKSHSPRSRGPYQRQATNLAVSFLATLIPFSGAALETVLLRQPPTQDLATKQHIIKKATPAIFSVGMRLQCWWSICHLISVTSFNQ